MGYIEWVHKVFDSFVKVWRSSDYDNRLVGLREEHVVQELGLGIDPLGSEWWNSSERISVFSALQDLDSRGLVVWDSSHCKLSSEGEKYPNATLESAWPQIFSIHLTNEEEAFMQSLAKIAEEGHDTHVGLREVHAREIYNVSGWEWDDNGIAKAYLLANQLHNKGLLRQHVAMGGSVQVTATYMGLVRVTRELESQLIEVIKQCLLDWEGTNIEFKLEINLKSDRQKAEFIQDILALANTKTSQVRRFLIIGFGNDTREFEKNVDPSLTQERLEQIINAYCDPPPTIRVTHNPWEWGQSGVIEIVRELFRIPYEVKSDLGGTKGIHVGDVYVRHGSHTELATQREVDELIEEGERARAQI